MNNIISKKYKCWYIEHPYARSFESRNLDCNIDPDLSMEERAGTYYNCSMLPLFDLGSLHHDFYLLNIRFFLPLCPT